MTLRNLSQHIVMVPSATDGSVTKYVYSATGEKLRTTHLTAVPNISVAIGSTRELAQSEILSTDSTDYLLGGSLTLRNGRIDKLQFDEGCCQATEYSGNPMQDDFFFYYYDRDHLGSIRQVVRADRAVNGTVLQTMDYYPFGAQLCDGSTDSNLQPLRYNGKEFDKMHGLNTYDYGARQYNPVTGKWDRMDPLCEKYYSMSPYAYCGNNPVRYIDPDGMYFDESNEKKAKKIERKAERRAAKLEHKAIRKEMRGKDPGNLKERAQELRKSAQDIRDMREEKSIEFCFAKANNVNNPAGKGHPNTDIIGTNDKGDPIICMFSESNMGSRLHEIRHGGQFKRGEIYLDKTNYCVYHEIDAYRAQFSWNGFLVIYKEVTVEDVMSAISNHSLTIESNIRVSSFDEINVDFVKSLKDPNDMFIYNFE